MQAQINWHQALRQVLHPLRRNRKPPVKLRIVSSLSFHNGGGTFQSPTLSYEQGTGMSPLPYLIRSHPRLSACGAQAGNPWATSVYFLIDSLMEKFTVNLMNTLLPDAKTTG